MKEGDNMGRRRRKEKKAGGDEAGSRDYDGSDRRTTCQTLEVISCFIEDFYGILTVWFTSQGVVRDEEKARRYTAPPSPKSRTICCLQHVAWTIPL